MPPFTRPTPNQRSAYRQSFVISDDKFTPLYVLSNKERQAPQALVSAMGLLQCGEYELLIAGEHDSPDSIFVNARYLGAARNIDQLYAACDITLALTDSESANQSIVKSLLCGTPVLISITSGLAELLSEKECLALDDITAESIASSLRQARRIDFNIPVDFAVTKGGTIEKHISSLSP